MDKNVETTTVCWDFKGIIGKKRMDHREIAGSHERFYKYGFLTLIPKPQKHVK